MTVKLFISVFSNNRYSNVISITDPLDIMLVLDNIDNNVYVHKSGEYACFSLTPTMGVPEWLLTIQYLFDNQIQEFIPNKIAFPYERRTFEIIKYNIRSRLIKYGYRI